MLPLKKKRVNMLLENVIIHINVSCRYKLLLVKCAINIYKMCQHLLKFGIIPYSSTTCFISPSVFATDCGGTDSDGNRSAGLQKDAVGVNSRMATNFSY